MVLETERVALTQKIETAFSEHLPAEELTTFLKNLKFADDYYKQYRSFEAEKLEDFFRGHTWREMSSVEGLVYHLTDLDYVDAISDDALVYYLPALMFMVVKDPDWLIYHGPLELKILGLLGKFSLAQINVIIAYADFIVRYEQATSGDDDRSRESSQPMIDTFENFKNTF